MARKSEDPEEVKEVQTPTKFPLPRVGAQRETERREGEVREPPKATLNGGCRNLKKREVLRTSSGRNWGPRRRSCGGSSKSPKRYEGKGVGGVYGMGGSWGGGVVVVCGRRV